MASARFIDSFNAFFWLFSAKYRRDIHEQWRHEAWYYVASDIAVGVVQLVAVGGVLLACVWCAFGGGG